MKRPVSDVGWCQGYIIEFKLKFNRLFKDLIEKLSEYSKVLRVISKIAEGNPNVRSKLIDIPTKQNYRDSDRIGREARFSEILVEAVIGDRWIRVVIAIGSINREI